MKRILLWILLSLALLIILAMILAPGIARRYTIKHGPELTGRSLAIDKVRVYWFSTKVRITGLTLFEADNQHTFISFDTLLVDFKPLRLIRNELHLQRLYLSGLRTFAVQEDSIFNFSDLTDKFSGGENADTTLTEDEAKEAFGYHLYDIELRNARFEYDNRNIGDTLILRNVSFDIPYVGWDQEEKSEAGLRLNLKREAYIEAGININPVAGDFDMTLSLQEMSLEGYSKLLSAYTEIDSVDGMFNAGLEIIGNINEPEHAVVAGAVDLEGLSFTDRGEKFLGANSIRLKMREIDLYRSRFLIDSLVLEQPYVYFELKDSTNNLFELLGYTPPDSTAAAAETPPSDTLSSGNPEPVYYSIQSFRFEQGVIDFTDLTTGDPFEYHLSEIEINTDSIESNADRVSVYASMLLNERGKLVAETSFDPLAPENFTLDYTITDFQLNDLNIYSRYYMGFPILYGEMFYRGHTQVSKKELISDNRLVMDNVELGEKGGGLHDLPIKFALYILKDRNDVVNLEIPVRGRTDDPQVSVGQIVWNTIKNLIIRTATAPYDFLSNLLGVDPGDIEAIEFGYRDTTLTEGIQKQLDLLVELEQIKPSMEIELFYFNDPEREARDILMIETGSDSIRIEALDPAAPEKVEADSLVVVFNDTRITNIEQYLNAASDSTQIVISRSDPRDPLNVGSRPRFEMRYSLKDEHLSD
jgi:hypothetical protein